MKVRFQAEADFNHHILRAVVRREPAVDFQTAHAAGLAGREDPAVLSIAAREDRLLVSHDAKTMPRHFAGFVAEAQSAGVLVVPQRLPIASVVEDLLLVWLATEAEEWQNRIRFFPL